MKLDDLLNNVPPMQTKQCKLNKWIISLTEDDRNAFWKAMDNPEIPTRHIWKAIKTVGCTNQESSIRSHRRGECQTCERTFHGINV